MNAVPLFYGMRSGRLHIGPKERFGRLTGPYSQAPSLHRPATKRRGLHAYRCQLDLSAEIGGEKVRFLFFFYSLENLVRPFTAAKKRIGSSDI